MDNNISDIQTESPSVIISQMHNHNDLVSSVSNYVSDFKNWLWLLGVIIVALMVFVYLLSNKKRINELSERKLKEFKQNRKYMPILFVELSNAKELLRYFIYGKKWKKKLVREFNQILGEKNLFKKYNKRFVKKHRPSSVTSLRKIKKLINAHISYFSDYEYSKKPCKRFPCYKYLINMRSYSYITSFQEYLQKCDIIESNIVLIKSSAGNGKTNLACNVVELLLKLKKRVIFINSKDVADSFKDYLVSRLNVYTLLKKFDDIIYNLFFSFFKSYIVIDAINENDNRDFPQQLFSEIDKLAAKNVKIILTCRVEYFEQRFSRFIESMTNKPYTIAINGHGYTVKAREKILERYCKNYDVAPPLSFISNQLFSASLLLVRLYFEVNNGKQSQDISLYRYEIYKKYIERLENKYTDMSVSDFIYSVAEFMVKNQVYNYVLINDISKDDKNKDMIRTISDDNLLTARKIVKNENTIAEREEEVIYFPFDELRDYCLARYLVTKYISEAEKEQDSIAKNNLYAFLLTLTRGRASPLEGILHYLYLHFKSNNRNDICEELLNKHFYDSLWNNYRESPFHSFALLVIFDSDCTLKDFELKHIATALVQASRDTNNLFFYLFHKEQYGNINQLDILLKILYSYTDFSELSIALSCYNSYTGYNYYLGFRENEYICDCLKSLVYSIENKTCLGCIEYLAIASLVADGMYTVQGFIELYTDYDNILQNIVTNTKCDALRQKAEAVLHINKQSYSEEVLIKEIKEEIANCERN